MVENSKIEWCDHTMNPWIGCAKVSPGCEHCYAETLMDTRMGRVEWGVNGTRVRTSASNWRKPRAWDKEAKASGVRRKVFCASLSDVFEDRDELIPWRADLFDLFLDTPNLDWLLLTKRPQNVVKMWGLSDLGGNHIFLRNLWVGTSVENQEQADKRIPELLKIPASVRFLSMEPLLGPVDLTRWIPADRANWQCQKCGSFQRDETYCLHCKADAVYLSGSHVANKRTRNGWKNTQPIDWVIVGGESGPNARPMHPEWVRSIRDQCQAAGVPFFFKQGSSNNWNRYKVFSSFPTDLQIREFPSVYK